MNPAAGCDVRPAEKESNRESVMQAIKNTLGRIIKDEQGGEVLEYALIAGLIVVASIAVIGTIGTKVLARWGSLNSSM
jgi:Flp pilus assembly pilin Flp